MQPLTALPWLTFTAVALIAFLDNALCTFIAIVIDPVTAVHTVAERYGESYFIIMLRAVPYFWRLTHMRKPRYIVCRGVKKCQCCLKNRTKN